MRRLYLPHNNPRNELAVTVFETAFGQLEGKQFLMGEKFSVADGYLFTILGWAKLVGFDLSKWPVIQQYVARVGQRCTVHRAAEIRT